jgi:hypothetical protein
MQFQVHALFRQIEVGGSHAAHIQRALHQLDAAVLAVDASLALAAGEIIDLIFHIFPHWVQIG